MDDKEPVWKTLMREAPDLLPEGFRPPEDAHMSPSSKPTIQDILHGKAEGYSPTVDLATAARPTPTQTSPIGSSLADVQRAIANGLNLADALQGAAQDIHAACQRLSDEAAGLAHVLVNAGSASE